MKRAGKWTFLLLFVGMGLIYLACVDQWQVYAKPLAQAKKWYEDLDVEERLLAYVDHVQTTGQPGFVTIDGEVVGAAGQGGEADQDTGTSMPSGENAGDPGGAAGPDHGDVPAGGSQTGEAAGDNSSENNPQGNDSSENNPQGNHSSENNPQDNNPPDNDSPEGSGDGEGGEPDDTPENGEPQYMTVEDDYFADAVFIGDSRTMGLFEYGGLEEISTFYASRGLTIYEMFEAELATAPDSKKKISVEEALQQNTFSKIYLMLGINEMGGSFEPFVERYREVVARLQELQPDAIIYVQAIIKVTVERSAQGDYITNEGIEKRNEAISQMADNEKVFFLDVNPLVCDDTGGMIASYTTDGVHLKAKYIEIWKDFLKTHAICLDE